MGHPEVLNGTRFVLETLFVADEHGAPVCVPIVKATFALETDGIRLAEEQASIEVGGVSNGDPENSSYIYEPETAFFKPATDIVLIGHACANAPGTTEVLAGIRVGPVQKLVKVIGDRFLVRKSGQAHLSSAGGTDGILIPTNIESNPAIPLEPDSGTRHWTWMTNSACLTLKIPKNRTKRTVTGLVRLGWGLCRRTGRREADSRAHTMSGGRQRAAPFCRRTSTGGFSTQPRRVSWRRGTSVAMSLLLW
jgi:hypothetical protein